MSSLLSAFILIFIAGVINGSFALPTKYTVKWRFENIWLNFATWAFVILPWVSIFILVPKILNIYSATPLHLLLLVLLGGVFFGIGQACFAIAINLIGISLGFAINLGLGTGFGFLLPLVIQHPEQILTPFGLMTIAGTALALIGIFISNHAGKLRHLSKQQQVTIVKGAKNKHTFGVILAVLAGLSSASQNFVFSYTYDMQNIALAMGAKRFGAAIIIWPAYMLFAYLPYAFYMLFLHAKNKSFSCYNKEGIGIYYFYALMMGVFWYGALLLYSSASQTIGELGPLVGWPLYLVLIILTSSFIGWRQREWENSGEKAKKMMKIGLAILVLSVVILGYSSSLNS